MEGATDWEAEGVDATNGFSFEVRAAGGGGWAGLGGRLAGGLAGLLPAAGCECRRCRCWLCHRLYAVTAAWLRPLLLAAGLSCPCCRLCRRSAAAAAAAVAGRRRCCCLCCRRCCCNSAAAAAIAEQPPCAPAPARAGHRWRRHGLRAEPRAGRLLQRPNLVPRPAEARHGAGAWWGAASRGRAAGRRQWGAVGRAAVGVPSPRLAQAAGGTATPAAVAGALPVPPCMARRSAAAARPPRPRRTGRGTSPPTTTSSCTIRRWSRPHPAPAVATHDRLLMCPRAVLWMCFPRAAVFRAVLLISLSLSC